jgi:Domain of unknown function (DUF4272)
VSSPTADRVSERALVLYALIRRAGIEHALGEFADEPIRIRQAEMARAETERWLEREGAAGEVDEQERILFDAVSGAWPPEAIADGMWRKEALGALLWSLRHVQGMPPIDDEFEVSVLNERIERYGSVSSFRANGSLRSAEEIEEAWHETDAWLAATEGRDGADATLASISAERSRALGWVLDDARPLP